MKKQTVILFLFSLLYIVGACAPKHEVQVQTFRDKKDKDFKKGSGSPIPYDDRKDFEGLSYFSIDSTYLVEGTLEPITDGTTVMLKTTQGKDRNFKKYGKVTFKLKDNLYNLYIYQAIEDDNSFSVLFTDLSNGETTYEVGRYIEPVISGTRVIIDFNKAYNPYCVYDKKYDCPIPPTENHLNVKVEAGEKMYMKK